MDRKARSLSRWAFERFEWVIGICSGEWLLTWLHMPNGGAVIAARAIMSSVTIYLVALGLQNIFDPDKSWAFSRRVFQSQILETLPWLGAIIAANYAALYSKFSSQWTYLAELYNQIKGTECNLACEDAMADWKAGFIEDADDLHLVSKKSFAQAICVWSADSKIKAAFIEGSVGGERRLTGIVERAKAAIARRHY